jgi:polar amino acid transport system substrate-binding protein
MCIAMYVYFGKTLNGSNQQAKITIERLNNFDTFGKPIAIQRGAYYGEKFKELMDSCPNSQASFLVIPNNQTKLWLLHKGRVSGLIEDKFHVAYQLDHNPKLNKLDVHYEKIHSNPVYFAFSRTSLSAAQLTRLENAFIAIQKDGSLKKLTQKYQFE